MAKQDIRVFCARPLMCETLPPSARACPFSLFGSSLSLTLSLSHALCLCFLRVLIQTCVRGFFQYLALWRAHANGLSLSLFSRGGAREVIEQRGVGR